MKKIGLICAVALAGISLAACGNQSSSKASSSSKTSSSKEFIDTINPKYSIISVGKNNRYGHPNKEVLDNLYEAIIYRTDYHGTIVFKVKNNKLKINTCPP